MVENKVISPQKKYLILEFGTGGGSINGEEYLKGKYTLKVSDDVKVSGNLIDLVHRDYLLVNEDSLKIVNYSSNKYPKAVDFINTGSVSAGGLEVFDYYADDGFFDHMESLKISIPAPDGATTGSHGFYMFLYNQNGEVVNYLLINAQETEDISFNYFDLQSGQYGNGMTTDRFLEILKTLYLYDEFYLRFKYFNNTDVENLNDRQVKFVVMREGAYRG